MFAFLPSSLSILPPVLSGYNYLSGQYPKLAGIVSLGQLLWHQEHLETGWVNTGRYHGRERFTGVVMIGLGIRMLF